MKITSIEDGIVFLPDEQPKTDTGNANTAPAFPKPVAKPKPDNQPAAAPPVPNQGSDTGGKENQHEK
jgi:hypothetical protein